MGAAATLGVEHVTRTKPACPMLEAAGDHTLHKHSTNMLELAVVRWSMLRHLPDPTASASYPSALCCACSRCCSGGFLLPPPRARHLCHMTAMQALQMLRWDGQ